MSLKNKLFITGGFFYFFSFVSLSYQQKYKFIPYNVNYIGNNNS
jgi:hypothetical protein